MNILSCIIIIFRLPQDVYQIAKVSKILHIMEKGNAARFKNKSLEDIEIDMEEIDELDEVNVNNIQQDELSNNTFLGN